MAGKNLNMIFTHLIINWDLRYCKVDFYPCFNYWTDFYGFNKNNLFCQETHRSSSRFFIFMDGEQNTFVNPSFLVIFACKEIMGERLTSKCLLQNIFLG